jgi:phospholipase A2
MKFQKSFLTIILLIFQTQLSCMTQVNAVKNLSLEEFNFLEMREKTIVNTSFQRFLKTGPQKFPRLAFCISGGGFRSMISGIGLLAGAQRIGLFDCASYMAGVSGGTWAILPMSLRNMLPLDYANLLQNRMCSSQNDKTPVITKLLCQMQNDAKFKLVDFWGDCIGEKLIGDLTKNRPLTFEEIRQNLYRNTSQPFPLFTTVIGQTAPNYQWLEISPFYAYSDYLGGSIPTYALGSKFDRGVCVETIHEKTLEFFIGVFGSAFSLTPGDVLFNTLANFLDDVNVDLMPREIYTRLLNRFKKISDRLPIYEQRLFSVKLPNYSLNLPTSQMAREQFLQLIDAGHSCNLPIIPLLRNGRNIDIIFVCDASSNGGDYDFTELRIAANEVKKMGKKFPSLQKFKSINPNLKIFYDEDPEVPMVIYFEDVNNVSVLKMNYSEREFNILMGNSFQAVINNIALITEAIKKKANVPNNFDAIPDRKMHNTCTIC